jgi:hypothetical protein
VVELQDGLFTDPRAARAHLVSWLAHGARDVGWALASVPRSRWIQDPPANQAAALGEWSALRHVRHLALGLSMVAVPAVRFLLGELPAHRLPAPSALQRVDAAWDPHSTLDGVDALLRGLGEARFTLLRLLESAPEHVWLRPLPPELAPPRASGSEPVGLGWLVARSYQNELEHLSAIWKLALYWDRIPAGTETVANLPLQQPDRPEE